MSFADFVGGAAIPVTGICILLLILTEPLLKFRRYLRDDVAKVTRLASQILVAVTMYLVVFTFSDQTVALVADAYLINVLIGIMVIMGSFHPAARENFAKQFGNILGGLVAEIVAPALGLLIGLVFIYMGASSFVGDFLLPREHLLAVASDRSTQFHKHGARSYNLWIYARSYPTTGDLYETIPLDQKFDAEIGASSGMILHARPISE